MDRPVSSYTRMGLGALCLLERFNKSEPLYMLCMFTSAACAFIYPFTSKPLGKKQREGKLRNNIKYGVR